ncbi:biotin transporter BioY [Pseudactinotalea terrae]|uniref:biotin transporter BioY n=1 Tax=Pseudactinotalea terrae TaxID=1743262 RepID=UPI0012E143A4|nr:biotin transporter BioY [Pseudactinotalea terrae]
MTIAAAPRRVPVLADLGTSSRVRDAGLVLGGTLLIAVFAQLVVPLPFTPVPLSLSTFAVLLTGLALGPLRALLSTTLYLVLGTVGVPIFAEQGSGWAFASYGYVIGYVAAAVLAGAAARRRADRSPIGTIGAAVLSTAVIYVLGVPWLMAALQIGLLEALALGVVPFLVGDAIKAVAAALLLPGTWRLLRASGHGARG